MKRYYYADKVIDFLKKDLYTIFGELTSADQFAADDLQKNTWKAEIEILKRELSGLYYGTLLFEYTIPRIGDRIDNVLIYNGIVFLLEFKFGEKLYPSAAIEQVTDYALDLQCFHKESHNKFIVPIIVCTEANEEHSQIGYIDNKIMLPLKCNRDNLGSTIRDIAENFEQEWFSAEDWINSIYMPTPTIVEAAQALYRGHKVEDISRNDATAINLSITTDAINKIIDYSKTNNRKSICFVTGVPGAGKTLARLNISASRSNLSEEEHAVFLSGNGPLVEVLQEALARDKSEREHIKKTIAMRNVKVFIQNIHHFRDNAIIQETPPCDKVAIFDEAQRAWTEDMLSKFMKDKKGLADFNQSEPEFLISIMDRHRDWATIICLIGGGQEINTGKAGLTEWFNSLKSKYSNWDVYVSDRITDSEYTSGVPVTSILSKVNIIPELHLAVSLRSFRSEKVAAFVKALLDIDVEEARKLYLSFKKDYPIVITRDIEKAKTWIKSKAKGSQRYGVIASSGAKRLRTHGVWVQNKVGAPN